MKNAVGTAAYDARCFMKGDISRPTGQVFLTAEWRHLIMLNYRVPRELALPYVPPGLELDEFHGETFASVVGFEFLNTRLRGIPIPGHRHFPEVNLRLYVRREVAGEVRRGVIFVREIVPRWAVATVARWIYNEPYRAVPMRHAVNRAAGGIEVEYGWRLGGEWCSLSASGRGASQPLAAGSAEEFIAEHYWGYGRLRDGRGVEYHVAHPPWEVWTDVDAELTGDTTTLYGATFAEIVRGRPASAFVAAGSPVTVYSANVLQPVVAAACV
jgi:uncharacterized protein YqjF (DUF2071 family)